VLVILSDGADTQSAVGEEEAIQAAQEKDVVIYGIGVKSRRFSSDFGKLKKFAESTGGAFFNSKAKLERLREAFARINREIKNQYFIGYVPKNERRDGSFREIQVRIKSRNLKVNHRKGYFASAKSS
jgi:Ca-activated chloride channel family protein